VDEAIEHPPAHFIRFNGWPGCWERPVLEATCAVADIKMKAELVMANFGKKISWVNDIPGFLTARVVAGIINEAYITLGEGVSTKEAIDTAMKLGTNYPYGPFEWAERIGIDRIYELLKEMAVKDKHYNPAALLKKEAGR
jgi:3-hydroxybutyryl-CoA dehydrogenase